VKAERHKAILKLISEQEINTQWELVEKLREMGFNSTQATVSRDIKELGLVKVPVGEHKYRYAAPPKHQVDNVYGRLVRLFQDSVVSYDYSENIILVKTLPGTAHAVASCIDNIGWKEVLGTVAGDDTILLVIKPKEAVQVVIKRFEALSM